MLTPHDRRGFTIVEVVVALVVLSTAVLGLAGSASSLAVSAASAELRALALEGVLDQLARIRLDPRYGGLDSLYAGTDPNLFGIPGVTRTTVVQHVQSGSPTYLDYKRITVTVSGPMVTPSISRRLVVAAP